MCGQQKAAVTSRVVARTPGWCTLCRDRMAASLNCAGSSGRKTPVETSPRTVLAPYFQKTTCKDGDESMDVTSGQVGCATAKAEKSTAGCVCCVSAGTCGQGSAAMSGWTGMVGGDAWLAATFEGGKPGETGGGRDSASATTFA